jgi:hypothetical protein
VPEWEAFLFLQTSEGKEGFPLFLRTSAGKGGFPLFLRTSAEKGVFPLFLQTNAGKGGFLPAHYHSTHYSTLASNYITNFFLTD